MQTRFQSLEPAFAVFPDIGKRLGENFQALEDGFHSSSGASASSTAGESGERDGESEGAVGSNMVLGTGANRLSSGMGEFKIV